MSGADYRSKAQAGKVVGASLLATGAILTLFTLQEDPARFWHWYLFAFFFLLTLGLGNLFLIGLEYLVDAHWSTPLRRVSECLSALIPFMVVPAALLFFGMGHLYADWLKPAGDMIELMHKKAGYLNTTGFLVRFILCFLVWLFFYWFFTSNSEAQDKTKDQSPTASSARYSTVFMILFAGSLTVFAIDTIMSLEPLFFSAIFGIYIWAGSLVAGLALLTIFVVKLREGGYLHPKLKRDNYYNLGLMMFGFNTFWAYVFFVQFLLIWYANIPEETHFYLMRVEGGWKYYTGILVVVHFIVPFFGMLSRTVKTSPQALLFFAKWLLLAHALDLGWLILPNLESSVVFKWTDIGFILAVIGSVLLVFNKRAASVSLTPSGDPKLSLGLGWRL